MKIYLKLIEKYDSIILFFSNLDINYIFNRYLFEDYVL